MNPLRSARNSSSIRGRAASSACVLSGRTRKRASSIVDKPTASSWLPPIASYLLMDGRWILRTAAALTGVACLVSETTLGSSTSVTGARRSQEAGRPGRGNSQRARHSDKEDRGSDTLDLHGQPRPMRQPRCRRDRRCAQRRRQVTPGPARVTTRRCSAGMSPKPTTPRHPVPPRPHPMSPQRGRAYQGQQQAARSRPRR
jgi:hypothetical protein